MNIWERIGEDLFISDGTNKKTTIFEFNGIWGVYNPVPSSMLNTIVLDTADEMNIDFVLKNFNTPTQIFSSEKSHPLLEKLSSKHDIVFNKTFPIVAGNKIENAPSIPDVEMQVAKTKKHYDEITKIYSERYKINKEYSEMVFTEDFFYHPNSHSFLAYYKGNPVCALILTIYEKVAAVINLVLDPKYKNINIAKFLTSKAISIKENYEVSAYYAMAIYEESFGLSKFLNAREVQLGYYWNMGGSQ